MSLQWDESLVLGFEEIDHQHRSIFDQYEKLSDAVQQGEPDEVIGKLVDFLFDYTHGHFTSEEKLMTEYLYPKTDEQRHEHAEFSKEALKQKNRVRQEGASRAAAIEISGMLLRWLFQHIKKHDREMVSYIKEFIALRQKYEN